MIMQEQEKNLMKRARTLTNEVLKERIGLQEAKFQQTEQAVRLGAKTSADCAFLDLCHCNQGWARPLSPAICIWFCLIYLYVSVYIQANLEKLESERDGVQRAYDQAEEKDSLIKYRLSEVQQNHEELEAQVQDNKVGR